MRDTRRVPLISMDGWYVQQSLIMDAIKAARLAQPDRRLLPASDSLGQRGRVSCSSEYFAVRVYDRTEGLMFGYHLGLACAEIGARREGAALLADIRFGGDDPVAFFQGWKLVDENGVALRHNNLKGN